MKRKLGCLIASLLFSFTLTSCFLNNPSTPDSPEEPGIDEPDTPSTSDGSSTPDTPSNPDKPSNPSTSDGPSTPDTPEILDGYFFDGNVAIDGDGTIEDRKSVV